MHARILRAKKLSAPDMEEPVSTSVEGAVVYLKAAVRAKVEHPFRVIKRQFGYTKVRYRGLTKNTGQVLTLFSTLYRSDYPLLRVR